MTTPQDPWGIHDFLHSTLKQTLKGALGDVSRTTELTAMNSEVEVTATHKGRVCINIADKQKLTLSAEMARKLAKMLTTCATAAESILKESETKP